MSTSILANFERVSSRRFGKQMIRKGRKLWRVISQEGGVALKIAYCHEHGILHDVQKRIWLNAFVCSRLGST